MEFVIRQQACGQPQAVDVSSVGGYPVWYLAAGGSNESEPSVALDANGWPVFVDKPYEHYDPQYEVWVTGDGRQATVVSGQRRGLQGPVPNAIRHAVEWRRTSAGRTGGLVKEVLARAIGSQHQGWVLAEGGVLGACRWAGICRELADGRLWMTMVDDGRQCVWGVTGNQPIVAWPTDIMRTAACSSPAEAANAISHLRTMLDGCQSLSAGRMLLTEQPARPKAHDVVKLLRESADWPCDPLEPRERRLLEAAARFALCALPSALWPSMRSALGAGWPDARAAKDNGRGLWECRAQDGGQFVWRRLNTEDPQTDLQAAGWLFVHVPPTADAAGKQQAESRIGCLPPPIAKRHVDRLNTVLASEGLLTRCKLLEDGRRVVINGMPGEMSRAMQEAKALGFVRLPEAGHGARCRCMALVAESGVLVVEEMEVAHVPERRGPQPPRRGGLFIDLHDGRDVTGKTFSGGRMTTAGRRPSIVTTGEEAAEDAAGASGALIRANFVRDAHGWQPADDGRWLGPSRTLVVLDVNGVRHYALAVDFKCPVTLARYADRHQGPRLRPTCRGRVQMGKQIGTITMHQHRTHPVWDLLTVAGNQGEDKAHDDERE